MITTKLELNEIEIKIIANALNNHYSQFTSHKMTLEALQKQFTEINNEIIQMESDTFNRLND